ncbi:hypothetical protein BH09VER1_BH09VER1_34350 [soil metagenome]
MAAAGGWEVRAIGTTASEGAVAGNPLEVIRTLGGIPRRDPRSQIGELYSYVVSRVTHTVLHTGICRHNEWEDRFGAKFDRLLAAEVREFKPDVILTFGGSRKQVARLRRAQESGCRIAFCVFNVAYLVEGFLDWVDAVLTPSEWLAEKYRREIGLDSVPLPTPIDPGDVVAASRDPIFLTMINPSVEKGVFFFARLAEELAVRQPAIPMLVIESRGTAGALVAAGRLGGFDLQRHESLMFAPAVASPRDLFEPARVLVVPSVIEDASGRVVAEALVNGVPPIVSDRGGLGESCLGAGWILPLPAALTLKTRVPVDAEAVEPWMGTIVPLFQDEVFYREQAARAKAAGEAYSPQILGPKYCAFFSAMLAG